MLHTLRGGRVRVGRVGRRGREEREGRKEGTKGEKREEGGLLEVCGEEGGNERERKKGGRR